MRSVGTANIRATDIGRRTRRKKMPPCSCGCGSSGFCAEHRARLAGIAGRFKQDEEDRKGFNHATADVVAQRDERQEDV